MHRHLPRFRAIAVARAITLTAGAAVVASPTTAASTRSRRGVTNAVKHGGACHVEVRLDLVPAPGASGTRLEGVVRDDSRVLRGRGSGMLGLERHRARLEERGGGLCLRDDPGRGVLRYALPPSGGPRPVALVTREGEPRGRSGPVTPRDHADPNPLAPDPA